MSRIDRRRLLLGSLTLGAATAAVRSPASGAESPPPRLRGPTLFQQTIPTPTGENGYEELIGTARTCLRLGQAVQTDTLISGLVGIAISAICLRSLGAHLDQLSVPDCDRLSRVCLEWLDQPDPMPRMLAAERQAGKSLLTEI